MKKMIMIAALMVMTIAAKAQNEVGQITLKPMVGMTIANITKIDNSNAKVGLAAGVEAEYGVSENFGLTVGAIYSMQGTKFDLNVAGVNVETKYNLDYINIPILANYYVAKGFAIKAGIQPAFNVRKKVKAEAAGQSDEKDVEGLKSFDFAIPVGLSYEFSDFVIDARYNWSLTKIADGDESGKNSVFMISLGYKFGL